MISLINNILQLFPDRLYLDLQFFHNFHRFPNWRNPRTFNEKLQWMKLYDRNPEYTVMVDKYAVKDYVAGIVGKEYIIPTLGVWDDVECIEWGELPNQFVLKTTNGGGNEGVIICKDKNSFDKFAAAGKLKKNLERDTYLYGREWPYKNVKKRIIAEQYMVQTSNPAEGLNDYKFFCFDGQVKALFVATERNSREEPFFDFYDADFKHLGIVQGHPNSPNPPSRPETFEEMKQIASKLSKGLPQARIDLYEVDAKVYFGEITFFHFNGCVPFYPKKIDDEWGEWIKLPN